MEPGSDPLGGTLGSNIPQLLYLYIEYTSIMMYIIFSNTTCRADTVPSEGVKSTIDVATKLLEK